MDSVTNTDKFAMVFKMGHIPLQGKIIMQLGKHIGLFICLKNGPISFKRDFPLKLNQVLVWSIWFGLFLICWNCCSGEQCEPWSFCLCFLEHDPKTVRECPRSPDVQRGLPRGGPLAGGHG